MYKTKKNALFSSIEYAYKELINAKIICNIDSTMFNDAMNVFKNKLNIE